MEATPYFRRFFCYLTFSDLNKKMGRDSHANVRINAMSPRLCVSTRTRGRLNFISLNRVGVGEIFYGGEAVAAYEVDGVSAGAFGTEH